jgi:hypothetical protein
LFEKTPGLPKAKCLKIYAYVLSYPEKLSRQSWQIFKSKNAIKKTYLKNKLMKGE